MEYHHSITPEEILRRWSLTLKPTLKLDYQKKKSVILQEKDQAVISVTQVIDFSITSNSTDKRMTSDVIDTT